MPTSLSAIAAGRLAAFLNEKKVPFTLLPGLLPGRWYFETFLQNHPEVDAIFYLGHGTEKTLVGSEVFWAMLDTENNKILKDKIVWTMACLSAVDLGPDSIKDGCRAWFGHLVLYNAAYSDESHAFMDDWIDYVIHTPKLLAQGLTCGEAFAAYKAKLAGYIARYEEMERDPTKYPNADWVVTTARSNLTEYRLLGDPSARLKLS